LPHPNRIIATPMKALAASTAALALFAGSAEAQRPCGDYVVVEFGDTLSKIAARCNATVEDITDVNPDLRPNRIEAGQRINLPEAFQVGRSLDPERYVGNARGDTAPGQDGTAQDSNALRGLNAWPSVWPR